MSNSSSSSSSLRSRAPGKAPMVEPEQTRRIETRSLARKRLAIGGESSSRPTAAVPVEPVIPPVAGDRIADPLDDPVALRALVIHQGQLIQDLQERVNELELARFEEDKIRLGMQEAMHERHLRDDWVENLVHELTARVHYMQNPPPNPAPPAPEEVPEDEPEEDPEEEDPEEDPEEEPNEEIESDGDDSGSDGDGDIVD